MNRIAAGARRRLGRAVTRWHSASPSSDNVTFAVRCGGWLDRQQVAQQHQPDMTAIAVPINHMASGLHLSCAAACRDSYERPDPGRRGLRCCSEQLLKWS